MIVLLVVHVSMNALLKQYQRVISTKLILNSAPIAGHVLMFVRLRQFLLNKIIMSEKIKKASGNGSLFLITPVCSIIFYFPEIYR